MIGPSGSEGLGEALTLLGAPSIRPLMAAGAILPPLFFERRRHASLLAPGMAFSGTPEQHDARKTPSVDHAVGRPAH
jgi:hypothetical protein